MLIYDPLATFQYMGGAIPIHLSLIFYGVYQYYFVYETIKCDNPAYYPRIIVNLSDVDNYSDIFWMTATHINSVLLYIIKK